MYKCVCVLCVVEVKQLFQVRSLTKKRQSEGERERERGTKARETAVTSTAAVLGCRALSRMAGIARHWLLVTGNLQATAELLLLLGCWLLGPMHLLGE